jgi:tRNA nucleotidyltransferase (CCA-adding enzyme)
MVQNSKLKINFKDFSKVFSPAVTEVIEATRKYGFEIRVVGGAVRDFVIGNPPRDIDFATTAEPAELIYIYNKSGITFDAGGIIHGTVKAKINGETIDVTSLNYRITSANNTISISHTIDWDQDAKNRDLTINSLSLDLDGNIYDYLGGVKDIKNQLIKFCPNPQEKIEHDPNMIMRWFKALGFFPNPIWLRKDWDVIKENIHLLDEIADDDRTKLGLASIMTHRNSQKILKIMCAMGANKYLNLDCE